jgi:hypothetical protein
MTMLTLTIHDESPTGALVNALEISLDRAVISVEELIRARVEREVADHNARRPDVFRGLVQPSASERVLNGYRLKKRKSIDAEAQVYRALDAFQQNGFFVLVDDRQVEALEEEIQLRANTRISFVKLVPLVGG